MSDDDQVRRARERRVLAANKAFYRFFREADYRGMDQLWSSQHMVACMHPGWPSLNGRAQVMASFKAMMAGTTPSVSVSNARVVILGVAAYVTCVETIADTQLVATNLFALQDGQWKMVHHQAAAFREQDLSDLVAQDALN